MKVIIILFLSSVYAFSQNTNKVDSLLMGWGIECKNRPGLVIAVLDEKNIVMNEAFGLANLEHDTELSAESVFDIASLAKQFTGFAIAKLESEGKLNVNQSIYYYFPEMKKLTYNISIKDLIHHSSGLRDIGELFDIGHFGSELSAEKTIEIMNRQTSLNFEPGSESDYSNTNYVLLAKIVEIVSGQTFRDWCAENIFEPLEMNSTFANDNPQEIIENRVFAYNQTGDQYGFNQQNGMALIGSSSVYSSSNDLIKWANALFYNEKFIPIFQAMQSMGKLNNGEEIGYGYGLAITNYRSKKMILHSGSTPSGFRSLIAFFPNEFKAIVLLGNAGNIDLEGKYFGPLMEELFPDENTDLEPEEPKEIEHEVISLSRNQLEKFTGEYLFNFGRKVAIVMKEDKLSVKPAGAPEMELIILSEKELYFPGFKSNLKFSDLKDNRYMEAQIYSGMHREGKLTRFFPIANEYEFEDYIGKYYCEELDLLWSISFEKNTLYTQDSKFGKIPIQAISKYVFNDEERSVNLIFQTSDPEITGFHLYRGSRMRKVIFKKLNFSNQHD